MRARTEGLGRKQSKILGDASSAHLARQVSACGEYRELEPHVRRRCIKLSWRQRLPCKEWAQAAARACGCTHSSLTSDGCQTATSDVAAARATTCCPEPEATSSTCSGRGESSSVASRTTIGTSASTMAAVLRCAALNVYVVCT